MGKALVAYHMPDCDTCDEGISDAPFLVLGNPELFCSLTCCKIFYLRSTRWISQHRKEKEQCVSAQTATGR